METRTLFDAADRGPTRAERPTAGGRALVGLLAVVALFGVRAAPARAADLVEPWDAGLTNLELYLSSDGEGRAIAGVVGGGLANGFSLGLLFDHDPGATRTGFVLIRTGTLAGGGAWDGWVELGVTNGRGERELTGLDGLVGFELSGDMERAMIPYVRGTVGWGDEGVSLHPLAGVFVPLGGRDGLHLELSGERSGGRWPLHLALGWNRKLHDRLELITEISWLAGTDGGVAATVGVIFDPRPGRLRIASR